MRLSSLNPRWLELNGERVAIMFRCPCCLGRPDTWLTCFFKAIADLPQVPDDYPIEAYRGSRMHRVLFHDALKSIGHPDPVEGSYHDVVSCKRTIAWQRTGDDFETLSCIPSIDASQSGHWHGFITAGEIR
jgi:Family of unknown function (DUF6527)